MWNIQCLYMASKIITKRLKTFRSIWPYVSAVIRQAILAAVSRKNTYTVSFHWRSERRTLFYLVCPGMRVTVIYNWQTIIQNYISETLFEMTQQALSRLSAQAIQHCTVLLTCSAWIHSDQIHIKGFVK